MNAPLPPDATIVASLRVDDICPSPSNPRKHFDEAYLAELAETIKAHGVIQPITVRPNPMGTPTYEIVVGECRWRSSKLAGLEEIPAFWRELDDRQVLEIQVIENLQRRDVHPIEEAEGYELLMKRHGYSAEQIAEKIGKSRSYVYARLKLTALCFAAREACYEGQLETSTALLIARIPGEKLQRKALERVIHGHAHIGGPLSYRDAKHFIRSQFTVSLKQATFSLTDATLLPEAGSCADCFKRSGNCPEICADLDGDADVCTDQTCFEKKKDARRIQLLDRAAERKVPVLEEVTGALRWEGTHDGKTWHDLDDAVDGDADGRSYREILGDAAPVGLVANMGYGDNKDYAEFGEATALAEALKAAGWEPVKTDEGGEGDGESTEEAAARREAEQKREEERRRGEAAQQAARLARENETAWRTILRDTIAGRLQAECNAGELNTDPIIRALAIAWLQQEVEYSGVPDELLAHCGFDIPGGSDEAELANEVCAEIEKWPLGNAVAFLFRALTEHCAEARYGDPEPPHAMLAMARAIDIFDPESLRPALADGTKKAEGPSEAARAAGEGAAGGAAAPTEAAPAGGEGDEEEEGSAPASPAKGTKNPVVAYRHPAGMTWSGRGKKPKWVEDWLAEGRSLDELKAGEG